MSLKAALRPAIMLFVDDLTVPALLGRSDYTYTKESCDDFYRL